jgi:hypothetical protein
MTVQRIAPLLLSLATLCLAARCGGPPRDAAARSAWVTTKASCGTYHYFIVSSSFTGRSWQTTVEITDDVATVRSFEASHQEYVAGSTSPHIVVDETWTETGAGIGTHSDGEPALTMEGLYDACERNVLSQDPARNDITFTADPNGALADCWYYPHGCADDCSVGVTVSGFACGALPAPS